MTENTKGVVLGDIESFKDSRQALRTRTLFLQTNTNEGYEPVFTLTHGSKKGLPSLRALYLSYDDPTEYSFATDTFGSVDYWENITSCTWMKEHIAEWRKQAEARRRAGVFVKMKGIVESRESKDTAIISAGKVMLNEAWKVKGEKPSKEQKEASLHVITGGKGQATDESPEEMMKRITGRNG